MLRPSPNHGTQRLPNDDDDETLNMWQRQENIAGKYVHNKIDEWDISAHVRFAPWHAGLYAPRAHLSHFTICIIFPAIVHACYFDNLLRTPACFVTNLI